MYKFESVDFVLKNISCAYFSSTDQIYRHRRKITGDSVDIDKH